MPNLLPGAPDAVAKAPQNVVGGDAFQRAPLVGPSNGLAAGLAQLGAGADDLSVPLAKAQAADDVANAAKDQDQGITRDPQGNPIFRTPENSFMLGRAGEAYNQAAQAGTQAALSSQVSERLTDIRAQYPTDPQGFKAASTAYGESLRSQYGGVLGNALANLVHTEGAQHYSGMVEAKASRDVNADRQSVLTSISDTQDQMRVLARQSGINTPTYDQLQDKLQDAYDKLGSNPLFQYGQDRADSELQTALSTNRAEFTLGQVDQIYNRKSGDGGKAGAQKMLDDQILNNPDLHLSVNERNKLFTFGMAHLAYLTSDQKARIDATRVSTDKVLALYVAGKPVDPALGNGAIAQAQAVGDSESVQRLQAYMSKAAQVAPYASFTDEQRVLAAAHQDYMSKVVQQENPTGNPSAGNGGGALQITSGTWQQIMRAHPELNLTADGRTDPAQNMRAGVALTNDNKAALKANGIPTTDANTYMAHFLGAGGATSFIKAMQANPNQPAAAINLAAATANPTIFYKNGDPTQPRTLAEVYALHTRRFGNTETPVIEPGANGAPTRAEIAANPFALAAYADAQTRDAAADIKAARNVGEAMITQFRGGNEPPPQTVAAYLQIATVHPELAEQAQNVGNYVIARSNEHQAESMPTTAQGQSYVDQVTAYAKSGDLNAMMQANALRDMWTKGAERLKTEHFNEASNRNWISGPPPPIDINHPEAWPASMAQRGADALAISSHTQNLGTPAFAQNELPAIKSIVTDGTLDQRVGLLSAITGAGMPEPILRATFKQLGADPTAGPFAVAGDVARFDPSVARGILEGQMLKAANPKLVPSKEIPDEFAKAMPFNDMADGPIRQAYGSAIDAYYAKLSAAAGDTTGVLDSDRFDATVKGVTGGVVEWRGGKAFAPWYGASQDQFDTAVRSITDVDLANSRGSDGVPLPASYLTPSLSGAFSSASRWRLESYGDGKYLIYSGADDHDKRQYLADARGGKFVLDLGSKRAEVEAKTAGELSPRPFSAIPWSQYLSPGTMAGPQ